MPEKNTVQLYFDRADVIMIAVSSTEVVTDINEKGCEILGYPKDEILGKNWFDNFLPESARENSRRLFHEMLGGSLRHVHYEHPVVSKKGEERVFNWHNILASDTIGNTIGIISSGADVTERRQAEKALAETENRLQSTLDVMREGWQIIDYDWRYAYVNEAVAKQGRRTKKELLGHTMMEMYLGIEKTEMFGHLKDCMTKRIAHQMENEFIFPDGSKGWFELSIEPVPAGILIFSLDITKRKKAEEALRKSEEEYNSLFANMIDGFAYCKMIFDENGKPVDFVYLQINDAFERITGLKRETVVGKKVTEAIPGTEKANPELFDIYGRVAITCKNEKFEIFFKPLNMWLYVSVYCPMKGYFAAIFVDITERKNIEEELSKYRHRLEDVVAERTVDCAQANEKLTQEIDEHQKTEEGLMLRAMILDNAREAIFLINSKGDFAYANDAASKTYGYSRDEFLNMNLRQLVREQDAPLIDARIKAVFEKGVLELETIHVRRDKTLMQVQVRHSLIRTLHGQFIVSVMRDITR